VSSTTLDHSKRFLKHLLDEQKLRYCQACGTCAASCPMAKALPDRYNPRKLIMKIHLDLNEAIQEDELWLCAWCYRCTERCPQGLQLTEIFLLTRNFASERGYLPESPRGLLEQIIRSGRVMAVSEDVDEWRQEYGLKRIGTDIGEEALKELHKIMGDSFKRRVEKRV